MKLEELEKLGYILKSWSIAIVRGEKKICVHLMRVSGGAKKYYYVSACPCRDNVKLKDAVFCEPVFIR